MVDRSFTFAKGLYDHGAEKLQKNPRAGLFATPGVEPSHHHESGTTRKVCQDCAFFVQPLFPIENKGKDQLFTAVGVLDGHGLSGECISEFCGTEIVASFRRHPLRKKKPGLALSSSMKDADARLGEHPEFKLAAISSGSTACIAVIKNGVEEGNKIKVSVCSIGDSGCVLGRRVLRKSSRRQYGEDEDNGDDFFAANSREASSFGMSLAEGHVEIISQAITRAHTPSDLGERARILHSGGFVSTATEPGLADARVFKDPEMTELGLLVSRALGDHGARAVGVSNEADYQDLELDLTDQPFLILASDGIWELIGVDEACRIVDTVLRHSESQRNFNEKQGSHGKRKHERGGGAVEAARRLTEIAVERWREEEGDYRDDIAIVVVELPL